AAPGPNRAASDGGGGGGAARSPEEKTGQAVIAARRAFPCGLMFMCYAIPLLAQAPPAHFHKLAHTYSIVAFDSATGDLGVAVQSKFPNVGGLVPWAEAGVGAVAPQSLGNTAYGER